MKTATPLLIAFGLFAGVMSANATTYEYVVSVDPDMRKWKVSGSFGTSFRAPNLRETFLAEQFLGISSTADPCGVPPDANNSGVYVPANDTRSAVTLANCILDGADPTQLALVANINIKNAELMTRKYR